MVEHYYPTGGMSLESLPGDMMAQSFRADDDLVRRVVAGETECFEDLMLRHRNHVRRIVRNHVPHDRVAEVAQEIFVKAYTGLGPYRFEEPFPPWLATIAVRSCYDFWRTQQAADVPVSALTAEHQRWIDRVMEARSDEDCAEQARRQEASEVFRVVVTLVHLDGHSIREAAALLGWSVINVKVRAHRARQALRNILEELETR